MACEDLVAAGQAVIVPNQLWVSSVRCGIELVEPRPSCGACSEGDERAPRDGGRAGLQGGNATVLGLCWSAVVGALAGAGFLAPGPHDPALGDQFAAHWNTAARPWSPGSARTGSISRQRMRWACERCRICTQTRSTGSSSPNR